jgi:hypothetical protein
MFSLPAGTQPALVEHDTHEDGAGGHGRYGEAPATADVAAALQGTPEQPQRQQQGHSVAQLDAERQEGVSYNDDEDFAAAGPNYADEGPSSQAHYDSDAAPAADERPFDDDAWDLGQRFREPRGEEADAAPAEASADLPEDQAPGPDAAPPEVALTPEEVEVNVLPTCEPGARAACVLHSGVYDLRTIDYCPATDPAAIDESTYVVMELRRSAQPQRRCSSRRATCCTQRASTLRRR